MSAKTLFLAWQHRKNEQRRLWFPIGRLDADVSVPFYRFRYIGGARKAREQAGFRPMPDFPEMEREYRLRCCAQHLW